MFLYLFNFRFFSVFTINIVPLKYAVFYLFCIYLLKTA